MTEMSDISKTATLTPVKRPETGPAGPETSRPGGFESLKALFKKLDPKNSENCLKNGVTNALTVVEYVTRVPVPTVLDRNFASFQ
jgi:hypothetical protein